MKRFSLLIGSLALCACTASPDDVVINNPSSSSSSSSESFDSSESSLSSQSSLASQSSSPSISKSVSLDVPFTSQAPNANWDDPYQEACEEASLIMVQKFLNDESLSTTSADKAILDLVSYEESNGYSQDVTIQQLAQIAQDYYGLNSRIIENPSVDDIKAQLSAGNPVIVPAAGRELGNPYFSGEGPWYHMLVITGYDSKRFITNDPGTRRGEGYEYDYDTLMNAIHDWTGVKEETSSGEKVVLVVTR